MTTAVQNTTSGEAASTPTVAVAATQVDKGNYILLEEKLKVGPNNHTFWSKQFKSLEEANAQFGQESILAAINSYTSAAMRNKARTSIPEDCKEGMELISQEQAEAYRLGEREKSAKQLFADALELKNEAAQFKATDPAKYQELHAKYKEALAAAMAKVEQE